MTKDTLLFMCTPDMRRVNARRAIASIKATDLSRAELYVVDNGFDPQFNHSVVMNDMLRHAARTGRNVVILDDDIEIHQYDWLDRLYSASDDLGADIVGCVHTDTFGHVNHMGIVVNQDGLTDGLVDVRFDRRFVTNGATYVPTLCSAIMLIREPGRYAIDGTYKKYFQDLDVCMQAWAQGRKVGIALDLRLVHHRGLTADRNPNVGRLLAEDLALFNKRWQGSLHDLYARPELQQYRDGRSSGAWQREYLRATRLRPVDPDAARQIYATIAAECFEPSIAANAHFHLHGLTGDLDHLIACHRLNPCHRAARTQLAAAGLETTGGCLQGVECGQCRAH